MKKPPDNKSQASKHIRALLIFMSIMFCTLLQINLHLDTYLQGLPRFLAIVSSMADFLRYLISPR